MTIPSRLLIHSCTYYTVTMDRDGNATAGETTTLSHVRIEPTFSARKHTEGQAEENSLTLYYDPSFSSPVVPQAPLGRVVWQGKTYTVKDVSPKFTHSTADVHHYEALLV